MSKDMDSIHGACRLWEFFISQVKVIQSQQQINELIEASRWDIAITPSIWLQAAEI